MKVDNAIILAAGTSSRFAPLSYEKHKAMTVVRGEVLIERQIKQIIEAGIKEIFIVTGYMSEQFEYLVQKYGVKLIYNHEYLSRNNNGSIWAVRSVLGNSYICSADNFFVSNPFETDVESAFYAAEYSSGPTTEWCLTEDKDGYINSVTIGGSNSWYMLGHTFWSNSFSSMFISILENEYMKPETKEKLWEKIYMDHLDILKMKIKKYEPGVIYEFDTLDELRLFDTSYVTDTRSKLLKEIAKRIEVNEAEIVNITSIKSKTNAAVGFQFNCRCNHYRYLYETAELEKTVIY